MTILGVDPGTLKTGLGIIKIENGRCSVLEYTVVRNPSSRSMPERLKNIYDSLSKIIKRYHPDELAIETAFYGKNVQSALKIGHARGVSLLAAVNHSLRTAEYSPREIKKAVTGNGAATKQQVRYMIQSSLGLNTAPKLYDISDALAVALCHSYRISNGMIRIHRARNRAAGAKRNWSDFIKKHPERVINK
jgi:crossover junction endodeoxyribonuclease RuvC